MQKFIAYGIPRSGTTALTWLINTHRQAICGNERFYPHSLTSDCFSKEAFLDKSRPSNNFQNNATLVRQKGDILAIGDKKPHYFLNLREITKQIPDLKQVILLRDLQEVMYSWNRRAKDTTDKSWSRGAVGLWAFYETLVLVDEISKVIPREQALLLAYDHLFGDEDRVRKELFDFLGLNDNINKQRIEKILSNSRAVIDAERPVSALEQEFIHDADYAKLWDDVIKASPVLLDKLQPQLSQYIELVKNNASSIFNNTDNLINHYNSPLVLGYLVNLVKECARYKSGSILIEMASKEETRTTLVGQIIRFVYGLYTNSNNDELLGLTENLKERCPDTAEIHLAIADIELRHGNKHRALMCIKRALELDPSNAVGLRKCRELSVKS